MSTSSKISAFVAYLLLVIGWLYVFLFRREDAYARYHAKQSVMLTIIAIGVPVVWVIVAWVLSLIPFVGIIMAVSLFALVIGFEIALLISWIVGMVYAWQAKAKPVPFIGQWSERLFGV